MADISSIVGAAQKPVRTGRLQLDPSRSVLDAFVLEIRRDRAMILMDDSVDIGSFPIDSAINIEVGREIWLAEIVGRVDEDNCQGIVADIRYRLPNRGNRLVEMPDRRNTPALRFKSRLSA